MTAVTAFAPGSVGNLGCGFDVLGLALESPGDRVTARRAPEAGVRLDGIVGDGGRLPRGTEENSAGAAARALLEATRGSGRAPGVVLTLEKGLPLSAGMGGSAASAVAAVLAVDRLLGLDADEETLLAAALDGERIVSGGIHADNVAPSLLGGIVLSRPRARHPLVRLPVPDGLSVALLRPHVEVETRDARAVLGDRVDLRDAVAQWGNTAALVAALYEGDLALLADSLEDRVAEPRRAAAVPGFRAVKEAALDAGALGCTLSGAGPSIFALAESMEGARSVGSAMRDAYRSAEGEPADLHLSPADAPGARIVAGDALLKGC